MGSCDVCEILQSDTDSQVIYQTAYWRVSLATDQYYLGRAYVTALQHAPSLSSLSTDAWTDLHEVIMVYEAAAVYGLGARHVTWAALMNNAYRDVVATPHVHWHVRPRYSEPVTIGGVTFVDREFGEHHQREAKLEVELPVLVQIARRLRGQIKTMQ